MNSSSPRPPLSWSSTVYQLGGGLSISVPKVSLCELFVNGISTSRNFSGESVEDSKDAAFGVASKRMLM